MCEEGSEVQFPINVNYFHSYHTFVDNYYMGLIPDGSAQSSAVYPNPTLQTTPTLTQETLTTPQLSYRPATSALPPSVF
jgi:hypothetical protein